jgi:hypothetical protein
MSSLPSEYSINLKAIIDNSGISDQRIKDCILNLSPDIEKRRDFAISYTLRCVPTSDDAIKIQSVLEKIAPEVRISYRERVMNQRLVSFFIVLLPPT